MSGLEAIGIAASIIQIADLGTKLSVKLFSFYRQIQNANQAIQHLSSDVALTCAILRELGDSLNQDEQSKLCSPEAHLTARQMLKQCEEVLRQIQNMIDESRASGKSRWQQATSRLRNVLNEPDVNLVRGNLERLKSTMLLLLNVVMFAGQIRSNHVPEMLHEQRNLIEILLKERKTDPVGATNLNSTVCLTSLSQPTAPSFSVQKNVSLQQAGPSLASQEVQDYNSLIRAMLREIDRCKHKLEKSRHSRIRDGVLSVHSSEMVHFQRNYGPSIFQCFDDSIFEYDVTKQTPCAFNSSTSSSEASGNQDVSLVSPATERPRTNGGFNSPEYTIPGSYFSPLCSPAVNPYDFCAAYSKEAPMVVEDLDLSASREETRPPQLVTSSGSQRFMNGDDKISQDTLYQPVKSNYQHILDGTRLPGISYPATTTTTLTSRRTSHKIAEQGRRNRINCALKELEALMPPTFIQDQKSQKLAASIVSAGEKEEKHTNYVFGKAFMVNTAIQYIKELRRCLKESDTSEETESPANLNAESDLRKIPEQGPRDRINTALKEIKSLIPSEFVQDRLAKDNIISGDKAEGKNMNETFVTQARSKGSIVELANNYIRELQRNLENKSGTLAQRLMPPRAPSANGRTAAPGKEPRSGPESPSGDPKEGNSGSISKPITSVDEDAIPDTKLPSTQIPSSFSSPGLYEAATKRISHEGGEFSQCNVAESITSLPWQPTNAVFVKAKDKAIMGKIENPHISDKDAIRPSPADLWETPQPPNALDDFQTFLDLDIPLEVLHSGVESSQNAKNYFETAKITKSNQEGDQGDNIARGEDQLNPRPWEYSGSKNGEARLERYKAHDTTWIENSRGHKRRFSATDTIDTNSIAPVISERLLQDQQKRSKNIVSHEIPVEVTCPKYSVFTDSLWPSSLERALERWTNLKQNEINTNIVAW